MKKLFPLVMLALIASCGIFGGTDATSDAAIVGTWTLRSVNGDPLPATFVDAGTSVQITAGTGVISADGTFSYSETWDGVADVTSGTWTRTGDTYTLNPYEQPGEPTQTNGTATVNGTTMTLTVSEASVTIVRVMTR